MLHKAECSVIAEVSGGDLFRRKSKWDFYLKDIARATTAAPTYFDPAVVQDEFVFLDGGLFANNVTGIIFNPDSNSLHFAPTWKPIKGSPEKICS